MDDIRFSIPEILSLLGMSHCIYLIVHIGFRKALFRQSVLPLIYLCSLGIAFFLDAGASRLTAEIPYYMVYEWFFWFVGPPLSVLVIVQFSNLKNFPPLKEFWVLLLIPLSFSLSMTSVGSVLDCQEVSKCEAFIEMLNLTGMMSGTICLLVILSKQNLFRALRTQKNGSERYWLIISLIVLNVLFLSTMFIYLSGQVTYEQSVMIKTILGIGFVYLVSTSLFRVFPKTSSPKTTITAQDDEGLNDQELEVLRKIERLMTLDKIYQEPTYSRTELAQECGVSEVVISRVINVHYGRSFPQLMNEYRIEDAKSLLIETDAPVNVLASEVGFNSLPSFNRAFKDITGDSPTEYRKKLLKK